MRVKTSLVPALALTALAGISAAHADDIDPRVTAYAERLAVTVCGSCHGARGVSEQPKFPNLAGQSADYLAAQLKAFRGQTRGDPDAMSYMWGMAAALTDETIDGLAAHYAAAPAGAGHRLEPTLIDAGRNIYENGLPTIGVPACGACHGPDAHGLPGFPRLAGQHAQYVLKQLNSFQNNMRNVAVMHGVAQGMKRDEMRAVAAFLESLP
jgi:cytochrome c553